MFSIEITKGYTKTIIVIKLNIVMTC